MGSCRCQCRSSVGCTVFEARRAQPPSNVPTGELTVMVTKTTDLAPVRSLLRRPDPTGTDQSTTFTLNVQYAPANWLVTTPSLLNSTERLGRYWSKWLIKPVATLPAIGVAMDLASTTARGREVLVAWNPPGASCLVSSLPIFAVGGDLRGSARPTVDTKSEVVFG
jgi:hypothetical protein